MRTLKNRSIVTALCLLAAALIAFVLLPRLYNDRQATMAVCRASVPIPRGTLIEAKHLVNIETGAYNLPDSVITDPAAVIGQYALTDIPQDDLILPDKVGDFLFSQTLDTLMKQGKKLVTLTLSGTAAGVSGHLQSGDIVSVASYIASHEQFQTDAETGFDIRVNVPVSTVIDPELKEIQVFDIENAKTESMEDVRTLDSSTRDPVPKTVTLIVTESQALKLVEAEYTGQIHLIFERRDV